MIGKKLSNVLIEIEKTLWEFEDMFGNEPPRYSAEGFRGACKIFMSAIMDRLWLLQDKEDMSMDDKCKMAEKAGEDLRRFIKTYTDIDTQELYK